MLSLLAATAFADPVLWDFDATAPAPVALAGTATIGVPADPWDGRALLVDPISPYGAEAWVQLGTARVTHQALTAQMCAPGAAQLSARDAGGAWVAGVSGTGGSWFPAEVDLSGVCGEDVALDLWVSGATAELDDVAFGGEPCAAFVDGDGDGACPQGVDRDGDGVCDRADEAFAADAVVDCDDAVYGPSCLTLSASKTGADVTLTVGGATPGGSVQLAASAQEGSTCAPGLRGVCLGLRKPYPIAAAIADDRGVATFSLTPPRSGAPMFVQAVEIGPGPADVSPVLSPR
jgi:hypothetical protein